MHAATVPINKAPRVLSMLIEGMVYRKLGKHGSAKETIYTALKHLRRSHISIRQADLLDEKLLHFEQIEIDMKERRVKVLMTWSWLLCSFRSDESMLKSKFRLINSYMVTRSSKERCTEHG